MRRTPTRENLSGEVFPHLGFIEAPPLVKAEDADWAACDAVFCGLPHGTAQDIIATLPASVKVIDMSADFRLKNTETYAKWYGREHAAAHLLKDAVYGLTEFYGEAIANARLVACPGCYPTAALLALSTARARQAHRCFRHNYRREIGRFGCRALLEAEHSVFGSGRGAFALQRRKPPACARNRAGNLRRRRRRGRW